MAIASTLRCLSVQGRVKLLSTAGSAAVLFNGIKGLARKILSQFKLLWFLNVFFGNTLLAILHLEIAKNFFAASSAEQLNSPQVCSGTASYLKSQTTTEHPMGNHIADVHLR